jgi:hypothetical protein
MQERRNLCQVKAFFSLRRYNRLEDALFPLMRAHPLIGQDHGD